MVIIPTDSNAGVNYWYDQTSVLDGITYLLDFRFNTREQCWYMSIQLANLTTTVVQGVKLVCSYPLLQSYAGANVPPGEFFCLTQNQTLDGPPGLTDLDPNGRCSLAYLSHAELPTSLEPWRL